MFNRDERPRRRKRAKLSTDGQIDKTTTQIARLKGDISLATTEVRRGLLREKLARWEDLLRRLQAEARQWVG